ncbi:MAG TPA: nodulation protein NfeD [Actinomycetota bacterium]|nr:nodulation protein NfeD [Actinomycetota bacterium]
MYGWGSRPPIRDAFAAPKLRRGPAPGAAWLLAFVTGLVLLAGSPASGQDSLPQVLVAEVDGAITPVAADYLTDGVEEAEEGGYQAFVVELNTPGGLDTSMRAIVQEFIGAQVPVIVYVSPQGARAASAGAIIAYAAHVAVMAPATAIGASTPVDLEGGDLDRKIINDAAAYAESIARLRGRNVEFAEQMVREGRSIAAAEALEIGAVDLVSGSLPELLNQVDGREVTVGPGDRTVTLETADAAVEPFELEVFRRIQQLLADPNLAFLFMSLGMLAIVYELASPGIGAGGILGAILLVLALFSLSVLPVNVAGILLLLVAAGLFAAELFAPGVGIAAAGGAVALLLSGVFLFEEAPGIRVSLAVILPVTVVVGAGVVLAGRLVVSSQRERSTITGEQQYLGRILTVGRSSGNRGQALVDGAWWNVRSEAELNAGDRVQVTGYEGLDLLVGPVESGK